MWALCSLDNDNKVVRGMMAFLSDQGAQIKGDGTSVDAEEGHVRQKGGLVWFLEAAKECHNTSPKHFLTDEDSALPSAIRQVFPDATISTCVDHKSENFQRNLKAVLDSTKAGTFGVYFSRLRGLMGEREKVTFEEQWPAFVKELLAELTNHSCHEGKGKYMQRYWTERKEMWAWCYVRDKVTFGHVATGAIEGGCFGTVKEYMRRNSMESKSSITTVKAFEEVAELTRGRRKRHIFSFRQLQREPASAFTSEVHRGIATKYLPAIAAKVTQDLANVDKYKEITCSTVEVTTVLGGVTTTRLRLVKASCRRVSGRLHNVSDDGERVMCSCGDSTNSMRPCSGMLYFAMYTLRYFPDHWVSEPLRLVEAHKIIEAFTDSLRGVVARAEVDVDGASSAGGASERAAGFRVVARRSTADKRAHVAALCDQIRSEFSGPGDVDVEMLLSNVLKVVREKNKVAYAEEATNEPVVHNAAQYGMGATTVGKGTSRVTATGRLTARGTDKTKTVHRCQNATCQSIAAFRSKKKLQSHRDTCDAISTSAQAAAGNAGNAAPASDIIAGGKGKRAASANFKRARKTGTSV